MTRQLTIILFLFFAFYANGQTFIMDGTPVTSCSGFFTDSGGNDAGYGPNENLTTTICPDLVGGTHVQLVFPSVELGGGDNLCFFDGPDATATQLSCAGDFPAGGSFIIQATAVNPSGCLTLVFTSDGAGEADGWSADMNCIAACQLITSNLVGSIPAVTPVDTGYIDICPGDGVEFFGAGSYPQDGAVYNHSDATSDFFWDFGDGTEGQGPNVFKVYDEPGGYTVQLKIIDQFGCLNTNFISQRVRVSTYPSFGISDMIPAVICSSDTVTLAAAALDTTASLSVGPNAGSFQNEGVLSDTLALPDGDGISYSTSIRFTEFSPGQILTDVNDFLGVCMLMEHSYMYDLDLELTCPDGTTVLMQDQSLAGGGEVFLGIPNESDDMSTNIPPLQGVGFEYCFRPNATNGTWSEYEQATGVNTLPAGDYNSLNPFDAFLGCPLNGEWTITITDQLAVDNGWIFEWSVGFAQDLFPDLERFTPTITDLAWRDQSSIIFYEQDSIIASPVAAGVAGFTVDVMDDFGCTYDTTILIDVLPATHPDCYNCIESATFMEDTVSCAGSPVTISAIPPDTIAPESVSYFAYSNERIEFNLYPPAIPLEVPTSVDFVFPDAITNGEAQIISVCVNLEHQATEDVVLGLKSPAGTTIALSTQNGSLANDYLQTCFTASAITPIAAGSAPFTGDFIPEESFNAFNGENISGNWSLLVADASNGFRGVLQDWTITFAIENGLTYDWAPSPDLSCTDCAEPEATPTSFPATYTVEITDDFGCISFDTIIIAEAFGFPAVNVICSPVSNSEVNFTWNDIGAVAYEVSLDGGTTWITPTGNFNHLYTGLTIGQMANLQVRAVAESDCPSGIGENTCIPFPCMMTIDTISTQRPACQGDLNGGAVLTAANGSNPIEYFVNGAGPFSENIMGLGAGPQEIIAIDADGCRDTVSFSLTSLSTPINLTTSMDSVDCTGELSGVAGVMATGGFGTFDYEWNTVPVNNTNMASGLAAGSYTVTVSDQAGCSEEATVIVLEPTPLIVTLDTTSITCNGANDGTAMLTPSGGTAPYSYSWTGGSTNNMITNLGTTTFTGTVMDAKGCSVSLTAALVDPVAITVNLQPQDLSCFENASGMVTATPVNASGMVTYNWSGPNSFSSAIDQPTDLVAGQYCVTITDDNNCEANDCIILTEPSAIILSVDSTQVDCFNAPTGSATVTASGGAGNYQYAWSDGNNQTTAQAINLPPGDYTVTVTDMNTCTQTANVNVPNGTEITLTIVSTPPLCSNTTDGNATAMAGGGAGSFSYQWDMAANGQNTALASNLSSGNYCVTATDMMGCTIEDCVEVMPTSILEIPTFMATPASCFGVNDGTAEVTPMGGTGTGTYTYLWNDDNAQFSNPAVSLPAGIYTVTVTDGNTCTATTMVEVIQPDTLTIEVTPSEVACFGGNTGTIVSATEGGNGNNTYAWSNGNNMANANDLFAGNYIVTVTDAMGCSATAATIVTEPIAPITVTIAQGDTACFETANSTAFVTVQGGTPAMGSYQYSWTNGGGTDSIATNMGVGTYRVEVTDNNGCMEEAIIDIQEYSEIEINIAAVDPSCFGDMDGRMAVNVVSRDGVIDDLNDYTYSWSNGGTGMAQIDLVGNETYLVTVTDLQGCVGDTSQFLQAPDQITLNVLSEDPSCFEDENGSVEITNVNGNTANHFFEWSNGATTDNIDGLAAGNYRVTVTDDFGCTMDSFFVLSQPQELSARLTVSPNGCEGQAIGEILAEPVGGTPGYNFEWSNGATTPSIDGLSTQSYSLILTDAEGCQHFDTTFVGRPDPMMVSFEVIDPSCFGDRDGRIIASVTGGVGPFSFSVDDENYFGTNTLVGLRAGTYPVHIRDQTNCTLVDSVTITDPPAFTVLAGEDEELQVGDSIQLSPEFENNVGDVQLSWTALFDNTLFCTIDSLPCIDPWVQTFFDNTYELYGVDENGCEDTDEITIKINKTSQIFVPTAFTPNGDNANDLLTVHGAAGATVKNFEVFDRWGTLLYRVRNFDINLLTVGWNGTYRGKLSPTGVYTWKAAVEFIDGTEKLASGHTTLLR